MHYLFIFGTRPEVIKLLPLAEALRGRGERVTLLSTAQHTDLVISAFDAFSMRCDLTLPPLPGERSLSDLVCFFVHHLPSYIHKLAPDAVVVQGDTVSAFSGALCAFLEQIPLIHIEAGLRTYERVSPYPEEALRRMISPLATVHFTTTENARAHLLREGIQENVFNVGNTVYDAMHRLCPAPKPSEPPYVLVTTHRRENDGAVREGILRAISQLASRYRELLFLFVLNANRAIRAQAHSLLDGIENVRLLSHQPPNAFYALLSGASLVLTDSGGVSEEAAALGLPTLVLRNHTEREWELEEGRIALVGTEEEGIFSRVSSLIEKGIPTEGSVGMPYCSVSERISDILQRITL